MKLISKIVKQKAGGWLAECVDGSTVPLSTRLTDNDVKQAVNSWRDVRSIFKVIAGNRFVPLGHKLGWYTAYEGTSVLFS